MPPDTDPSASGRPVLTLKELAARAGLSVAAVSYALRNHPKLAPATCARVQALARELGYRPNPRVASLMSHIRRAHARATGECIAFVWVHTARDEAARDPFLRKIRAGAFQRAEQMGFKIEEFYTEDPGMTDLRLQEILLSRGIIGVLLSPVLTSDTALSLNWDWRHFAAAVIGNVTWTPELHHAGHHHYLAMRLVLSELARLGRTRPAALIETKSNDRAKRAWEASFLANHADRRRALALVRVVPLDESDNLGAWLDERRPDALIVSTTELLSLRGVRSACRRRRIPIVTLAWNEATPAGIGGIDQNNERVAAHAVDLVVAQLNANEAGPPDLPRIMLLPGRWVPPASPKARSR